MKIEELENLERGCVLLVNQFGTEEVATLQGFDRDSKIHFKFVKGGMSVGHPSHVIKVLDNKYWKESEVFHKAYEEHYGFKY